MFWNSRCKGCDAMSSELHTQRIMFRDQQEFHARERDSLLQQIYSLTEKLVEKNSSPVALPKPLPASVAVRSPAMHWAGQRPELRLPYNESKDRRPMMKKENEQLPK